MRVAASRAKPISWVDDHHGHAFAGEIAHHQQYFADELWVQRACRLVKKHQHRFHGERAGYSDALLLAAGEL